MKVFIEKSGTEKHVCFKGNLSQLLTSMKINPETVLVVKGGAVITEDEELSDDDEIKVLSIISGG